MKQAYFTLAIWIVGFLVQSFFPWWSIALVCFAVAFYFHLSAGQSYALAFAAVGVLWSAYAGWLNFMNEGVMMSKMQILLMEFLKSEAGWVKWLVNGLMWGLPGSLVGGFAALSGTYARQWLLPPKQASRT